MELVRIPPKDLGRYKQIMLMKQNHKCGICKGAFTKNDDPVVDHCHISGRLRGILHRSCNGVEGKMLSAATRMSGGHGNEALIQIGQRIRKQLSVPRHYNALRRIAARGHAGVSATHYMIGLSDYLVEWQNPMHNLVHHSHHFEFERKNVKAAKVNWRNKHGQKQSIKIAK